MGAIEDEKAYALLIRESVDDGSDFTNPPADYRRLFVGEDGDLHLKDSAGTVTDFPAGGGGGATFHGVRAVQSANTALTNGSVVYVAFDGTDDYDTDGYHDPASNNTRLTVPTGQGGYYLIVGSSLITGSPGNSYCVIRKNGTTIMGTGTVAGDTAAGQALVVITLNLAQGDYVEFGIKVGAASKNSTDAGVAEPYFQMHKIA